MPDAYLLAVLSRMVATRLGYTVSNQSGAYRFSKPNEPGFFGNHATETQAWVDAATSIVEDAHAAGVEGLVAKHATAP